MSLRTLLLLPCLGVLALGCLRSGFEGFDLDAAYSGVDSGSAADALVDHALLDSGADDAFVDDAFAGDASADDAGAEDAWVPTPGSLIFSADSIPPFTGSSTSAVSLDEAGARLEVQHEVVVSPTSLPAFITAAAAVATGDLVYIAGGIDTYPTRYGTCQTAVLAFDVSLGSLSQADTLPVENQGAGLLRLPSGEIYSLMGCCNDTDAVEEARVYQLALDSSTPPTPVGSFPLDSYHFASAVMAASTPASHLLVAAGGYGSGPLREEVQTFDPVSGTGAVLASHLPSARCLLAGAVVGDHLFLFGGNTDASCRWPDANELLDEIVRVSLSPEEVALRTTRLPEPVAGACAVTRGDGSVLLLGGLRSPTGSDPPVASTDTYLYDPASDSVSHLPVELPAPRAGMTCTVSGDGPVVLGGGIDDTGVAADETWLFEPYATSGQLHSPVLDSGYAGAHWTALIVDADLPPGSSLTYQLRVGDDETLSDPPVAITPADPLPDSLPTGRYAQLTIEFASATGGRSATLRSASLSHAPE